MNDVVDEILAERDRQICEEGCDEKGDDRYVRDELSLASASYILHGNGAPHDHKANFNRWASTNLWPWSPSWWKPKTRRRDLIRAAALLVAEIERLDRAELNK